MKLKGFTLMEMMVVILLIGVSFSLFSNYYRETRDSVRYNSLISNFATNLQLLTSEAKNGVTTPNLKKFQNSTNSVFRQEYESEKNKQGDSTALSRFGLTNQTAFYYGLYFTTGKSFLKKVQFEQEGCDLRRKFIQGKEYPATVVNPIDSINDINYSQVRLNLDIKELIRNETNFNTAGNVNSVKEAELLDAGSCYISSENFQFVEDGIMYLTRIDFKDSSLKPVQTVLDGDVSLVILVNSNNPYDFRFFRSDKTVNSLELDYYSPLDGLNTTGGDYASQEEFLRKNYGALKKPEELTGDIYLTFANVKDIDSGVRCDDEDFVDFSTRFNAGEKFRKTQEKGLICLKINQNSIREIQRSIK